MSNPTSARTRPGFDHQFTRKHWIAAPFKFIDTIAYIIIAHTHTHIYIYILCIHNHTHTHTFYKIILYYTLLVYLIFHISPPLWLRPRGNIARSQSGTSRPRVWPWSSAASRAPGCPRRESMSWSSRIGWFIPWVSVHMECKMELFMELSWNMIF